MLVGDIFACFAMVTSSLSRARLRLLPNSNCDGSMFSESEISGDGARLLRFGAEYGVMAADV